MDSVEQIDLLSGDEVTTFIPHVAIPVLHLLGGSWGPFEAQIPLDIPRWLAGALVSTGKGRVQRPAWLEQEAIDAALVAEAEARTFHPLPLDWVEAERFSRSHVAPDTIQTATAAAAAEDLRARRFAKARAGLSGLSASSAVLRLNGLCWIEVAELRPFVTQHFDNIAALSASPAPPQAPAPTAAPQRRVVRSQAS